MAKKYIAKYEILWDLSGWEGAEKLPFKKNMFAWDSSWEEGTWLEIVHRKVKHEFLIRVVSAQFWEKSLCVEFGKGHVCWWGKFPVADRVGEELLESSKRSKLFFYVPSCLVQTWVKAKKKIFFNKKNSFLSCCLGQTCLKAERRFVFSRLGRGGSRYISQLRRCHVADAAVRGRVGAPTRGAGVEVMSLVCAHMSM